MLMDGKKGSTPATAGVAAPARLARSVCLMPTRFPTPVGEPSASFSILWTNCLLQV